MGIPHVMRAWLCVALAVVACALPSPDSNILNAALVQTPTINSDMMNANVEPIAMESHVGEHSKQAEPPKPVTSTATAPPAAPENILPQKLTVEISSDQKRTFAVFAGANCKNRAHIMSSYIRRASKFECQSKCAFDSSCTGYNIEASTVNEGECTIFKGECERVGDSAHDLYVIDKSDAVPPLSVAKVDTPPPAESNPLKAAPPASPSVLNLTIVIPTVRRFQRDGSPAPEHYLSPLVQKLWGDMSPDQQKNVNFLILNADKEPEKHVEALGLVSIPSVKILSKPNWEQQTESALKSSGSLKANGEAFLEDGRQVNAAWVNWVAAEDVDGAYLLEQGMKLSPYVLFLEDDVWPTTKAIEKLTKLVNEMKTDDWLFLDLYTPNLDWAPGMLDVGNGQKYAFHCCTQSMLFRADRIPGIIQYWRSHLGEPVDDNLRNYRDNVTPDLFIYAARPNLFEHIGAYSSNAQKSTGTIEHQSIDFVPLLIQLDTATHN